MSCGGLEKTIDLNIRRDSVEEEIWKDVPGFEGFYQASNFGRIRSLTCVRAHERNGKTVYCKRKGVMLTPKYDKTTGYYRVILWPKCYSISVHQVIARSFIGEQKKGIVVNHIDGNKRNNNISNLEYITQSENMSHHVTLGNKGGFITKSVLTNDLVLRIYDELLNGAYTCDLMIKYGVHGSTISGIRTRKTWSYLTRHLPDCPRPNKATDNRRKRKIK